MNKFRQMKFNFGGNKKGLIIMNQTDYDDLKEQINSGLDTFNRKTALKMIGEILRDYDLITASNLVKADCEPYLHKQMFEDLHYSEGNEESGFVKLKEILDAVEEIVNLDNYISEDIHFEYFVRPETEEEAEENGHTDDIEWFTKDESIDIDKVYIQFEGV